MLLLYGLMFSYLIFGSYLTSTKYFNLSTYIESCIFIINIVILLVWESLNTYKIIRENKYDKVELS